MLHKKFRMLSWGVLLLILLAACSRGGSAGIPKSTTVSVLTPDFFGIGEEVAAQLTDNLRVSLGLEQRIIMATVVDIDDLYHTNRFGRTLSEAVSTRLFKRGFGVVEIRKSGNIFVKDRKGELVLTRDASLLAASHDADAVIVGIYSLTPQTVIVNMKLISSDSSEVLSVAGIEIQRTRSIDHMLSQSAPGRGVTVSAYER